MTVMSAADINKTRFLTNILNMLERIKKLQKVIKNTLVFPLNDNKHFDDKTVFIKLGSFSSCNVAFSAKKWQYLFYRKAFHLQMTLDR